MNVQELIDTASTLVAGDKGLLAMDESNPTCNRPLAGAAGGWLYSARVPAIRPASDYTARVIPQHSGVAVPLEDARILWKR